MLKKIEITGNNITVILTNLSSLFNSEDMNVYNFIVQVFNDFLNKKYSFVNIFNEDNENSAINSISNYLKTSYYKYSTYIKTYTQDGKLDVFNGDKFTSKTDGESSSNYKNEESPLNNSDTIDTPNFKNEAKGSFENNKDDVRNNPIYTEKFYELIYKYPTIYSVIITWLQPVIYEMNIIY